MEGGALVAKMLGTQVMENEASTLTAMMVNVEIPLATQQANAQALFIQKLLNEQNSMVVPYKHNGKWWVRLSAQIYNSLEDFEKAARAIQKVCSELC